MAETPTITFAEAVSRLEAIVDQLERGDVPLEESMELFEEGVRLARLCSTKLSETEKKIEKLTKDELGEFKTGPAEDLDAL